MKLFDKLKTVEGRYKLLKGIALFLYIVGFIIAVVFTGLSLDISIQAGIYSFITFVGGTALTCGYVG